MSNNQIKKTCKKCGESKSISEFWKNKKLKDGYLGSCKICMNKIKSEYRKTEKYKEWSREYREETKERDIEYRKRVKKHRAKRQSKYHQRNKEKRNEYSREYYDKNKDIAAINAVEYRAKNKEQIYLQRRDKLKNNIEFKLRNTISTRIHRAITYQYSEKAYSSIELLGCTISEARKHIESLFLYGMNWENHGQFGWHIDHIKPCISFDLSNPEQQKECFHYTNLQPLWWQDNLSKAGKIVL